MFCPSFIPLNRKNVISLYASGEFMGGCHNIVCLKSVSRNICSIYSRNTGAFVSESQEDIG